MISVDTANFEEVSYVAKTTGFLVADMVMLLARFTPACICANLQRYGIFNLKQTKNVKYCLGKLTDLLKSTIKCSLGRFDEA